MQDYATIFDLTHAGYRQWTFPAFGLIFVGIGTLLVRFRNRLPHAKQHPALFPSLYLGFSVLWTLYAFVSTYGQYHILRSAMREGRVAVVAGPVEHFVPMPYNGHAMERFTVGGVRFGYSDYEATAGFNNTTSHGGPIRSGRLVRITHVGGDIVRLEVHR